MSKTLKLSTVIPPLIAMTPPVIPTPAYTRLFTKRVAGL